MNLPRSEFDQADAEVDSYVRRLEATRGLQMAAVGIVATALGGAFSVLVSAGTIRQGYYTVFIGCLCLGLLLVAYGIAKWVRFRFSHGASSTPSAADTSPITSYSLGGPTPQIIEIDFVDGFSYRATLNGVSLGEFEAPALEERQELLLPDGRILTLQLVPDFLHHRKLVVLLDGLPLLRSNAG